MAFSGSLAVMLLVSLLAAAGCFGNGPEPAPTPPVPNACTDQAAPSLEQGDDVFRGENAFEYMIGLICDHTGPFPKERARVPGTPDQTEGRDFLLGALRGAGFQAAAQQFNGSTYEAIMQRAGGRHAVYYTNSNYCDSAERTRMRGLDFYNVVGRGGDLEGPVLLLMAHWDSKRFANDGATPVLGANDGAAGVGVLLEFARAMAQRLGDWEVRILLTDGEDGFDDCHPLAGSTYYADRLEQAERDRLDAIILLDMVGDLNSKFYRGCGDDTNLAERIWAAAQRLDVRQFVDQEGCSVVDDHTPFEDRGMSAVDVIPTPFPPYWHTDDDVPEHISREMLGDVGRILEAVVQELAGP